MKSSSLFSKHSLAKNHPEVLPFSVSFWLIYDRGRRRETLTDAYDKEPFFIGQLSYFIAIDQKTSLGLKRDA